MKSNGDGNQLRETPFEPNEIAKFKLLKQIKPERLAARLPAYVKKHLNAVAVPKPFVFVPNQPPVYPTSINGVPLFTSVTKPVPKIPGYDTLDQASEYIAKYDELNNLVPVEYVYHKGE